MRRSRFSEQRLVVVLFIMVLVIFFFAQADSSRIEKMYLNNNPTVTTSMDQSADDGATSETGTESGQAKRVIPSVHLR